MWLIKFDGVDGESKAKGYEKWTDLGSIQYGVTMPGAGETGQSRRRGTARFSEMVFTQESDKAGPKLEKSILEGHVFKKVEIVELTTFGDARAITTKFDLEDVKVTSYSYSGHGGGDAKGMESYSINFGKIKKTYTEYNNQGGKVGSIDYGWKVEEGEKA